MAKYNNSGWHRQSIRHSRARKYGKAGGKYSSTQFGILTPKGEVTKSMSINLSEVKSPDPLAYSYGFFQGKTGQSISKDKDLAPEYIRGYKEGKKQKDTDKDGVPDKYDCQPNNPKKQDKTNKEYYYEYIYSNSKTFPYVVGLTKVAIIKAKNQKEADKEFNKKFGEYKYKGFVKKHKSIGKMLLHEFSFYHKDTDSFID